MAEAINHAPQPERLISMQHISKSFGEKEALRDISFSVGPEYILGFLGPSGAGKTTTIKILTGQLRQSGGEAFILGQDSRKVDYSLYTQVGIVTDNSGIYEKLTVYDNLLTFARIMDVDPGRVDELLDRLGLAEDKKKQAQKLSKGMKQRLVLARAILHRPKVLFLDEPTGGLDPSTTLDIHRLLRELKQGGTAIFLTTHNMEEATKLCDNVALLHEGEIVEMGAPRDICLKHNEDNQYSILLRDGTQLTLHNSDADRRILADHILADNIQAIHSSEPTLETVFLKLTGRELQ